MATTAMPTTHSALTDEMLARFQERASFYDRENRFFHEDFEELRRSGYLTIAVPSEMGGAGLSLVEVNRLQRRLAYHAPATAIAINMHHYWVGVAADLWRAGDASLEWMLTGALAGEIFAAGHAESGNDAGLQLATMRAERVEGGYRLTGRKSFGSLTPVWTMLGVHAMDASDPEAPKIVHAFVPRQSAGLTIVETWDTLGMRATRSDDTIFDGVFVPDHLIGRIVPAGPAGIDAFILSVYAWPLLGFAAVYAGIARRALDLTVESVTRKKTLTLPHGLAHHPGVQHGVAEMALALQWIEPYLDRICEDWSNGVDNGEPWPLRIVAAKYNITESSWRVVDRALDLAGGAGIFRRNEIERLFRDARLGRIHPANSLDTHEIAAKLTLGIGFTGAPRWG
jgi:alkylation response protein AidB-like acyl-CoA dehydrogenase